MSKYISGNEIIRDLGILDFEFYNEYVRKGLTPLNHAGKPYSPYAVMVQLFNLNGQQESLFQLQDSTLDLDDESAGSSWANLIVPQQRTIEYYKGRLNAYEGLGWPEFELPQAPNEARYVLDTIRISYFDKEELFKFFGYEEDRKPAKALDPPKKLRKLRPDQQHRIACCEAARKVWNDNPEITIADMIHRDELNEVCEGKVYGKNTVRNWIKELAPNNKPGRRPKKVNT